jgi:hypothetical protein
MAFMSIGKMRINTKREGCINSREQREGYECNYRGRLLGDMFKF